MAINNEQIGSITVGGMEYAFAGNYRKKGKRLQHYLENKIGLHFIIISEAYNNVGDVVPDYVAIYISADEKDSNEYVKWWDATIKELDV